MVQLEPTYALREDRSRPHLDTGTVVNGTSAEVLRLAREARDVLSTPSKLEELERQNRELPGRDVEIITLGTGSASPSKYRNVSASLVRVPGQGSYLFDCGENTLGQLRRIYNPSQLSEVLADLKAIWISHLHADHHLGITSVIKAWYKEVWGGRSDATSRDRSSAVSDLERINTLQSERRLFVIAGTRLINWLGEYASMEDYGYEKLVPLAVQKTARPLETLDTLLSWEGSDPLPIRGSAMYVFFILTLPRS